MVRSFIVFLLCVAFKIFYTKGTSLSTMSSWTTSTTRSSRRTDQECGDISSPSKWVFLHLNRLPLRQNLLRAIGGNLRIDYLSNTYRWAILSVSGLPTLIISIDFNMFWTMHGKYIILQCLSIFKFVYFWMKPQVREVVKKGHFSSLLPLKFQIAGNSFFGVQNCPYVIC